MTHCSNQWNRYLWGFYSKSEFKNLLSLASKESCFFFNDVLYKQKDVVAMGSPLGPTLANAFLLHYEKIWLEWDVPRKTNLYFIEGGSYLCQWYFCSIWLESQDKLIKFRDYFNGCYPNGCFHMNEVDWEGWKTKFFRCKMFSVKKARTVCNQCLLQANL